MLAIRLSDELENSLTKLSLETGRTKAHLVREAITDFLDKVKNKKRFEAWVYDIDNPQFKEQLRQECQDLDKSQDEQDALDFCERAAADLMNNEEWGW